ncbi:ribonuclease P protein component [candidate division WOR-3 bacterium]|nr:ribonuclease P protein component [candidate division WOR-3 bacterium]
MLEEEKKEGKILLSLRKNNKLKKNSEFKEIYRSGERKSGEDLTIIFSVKKGFRFGISFKRDAKPAVKRNRTKRRLMEIVRKNKKLIEKDIHMVIYCTKKSFDLSFDELATEFGHLLKDARIVE